MITNNENLHNTLMPVLAFVICIFDFVLSCGHVDRIFFNRVTEFLTEKKYA